MPLKIIERIRGRKLQERRQRYFAEHPLCVGHQQRGKIAEATELDHVIPLHKGGSDDESNWQGLCFDCHKTKTRRDVDSRKLAWGESRPGW